MSDLEQFCIIAKTQKGRACAAIIQQVLNNKKIYLFSELLSVPSIASLSEQIEYSKSFNTLELFAYGTYLDYKSNKDKYLEITEYQIKKLKHLTILTLSQSEKEISYKTLQLQLDIENLRELEDLIIEVIYLGLINGKLDQRAGLLTVKNMTRRDVKFSDLDNIIAKLTLWQSTCRNVIKSVNESSDIIKTSKIKEKKEEALVQKKADEMKSMIKDSLSKDNDDGYGIAAKSKRNKNMSGTILNSFLGGNRY